MSWVRSWRILDPVARVEHNGGCWVTEMKHQNSKGMCVQTIWFLWQVQSFSRTREPLESAVSVSLPVTQAQETGLSRSQGLGSLLFSYALSWRISFTQVVLLRFINWWFSNVSSKIDPFSELQMRPFLWCLTALQNQYVPHGIPYLSPLRPPPNILPVPGIQLLSFL